MGNSSCGLPSGEHLRASLSDAVQQSTSVGLVVRLSASAENARPNDGGTRWSVTRHGMGERDGSADRSASADGRGGAAAPRLDKRTYLDRDQGRWSVVFRDYGSGLGEIGWSFVPNLSPTVKAVRGKSAQHEDHEDRAVRRARSRLRQLILATQADHLLTLTYRENVTDYRQACRDLSCFVRRIRKASPGWLYVAVPEKQKRGAWHWHMAVVGRQDVGLLRGMWRAIVGDGNIDVQKPPARVNKRLALVRYLGKYLAKGFAEGHRELNGHRYRASQGIVIPAQSIAVPDERREAVREFVKEHLHTSTGAVGHEWVNQAGTAGWACSWE